MPSDWILHFGKRGHRSVQSFVSAMGNKHGVNQFLTWFYQHDIWEDRYGDLNAEPIWEWSYSAGDWQLRDPAMFLISDEAGAVRTLFWNCKDMVKEDSRTMWDPRNGRLRWHRHRYFPEIV